MNSHHLQRSELCSSVSALERMEVDFYPHLTLIIAFGPLRHHNNSPTSVCVTGD